MPLTTSPSETHSMRDSTGRTRPGLRRAPGGRLRMCAALVLVVAQARCGLYRLRGGQPHGERRAASMRTSGLDARCAEGETPLHCAAFHGASDACCSLLEAHADPAALTTADGDAALHLAALRGHAAAAVVLVREGASTSQGNRDRCTPVEIAELTVCPVAFRCESQER